MEKRAYIHPDWTPTEGKPEDNKSEKRASAKALESDLSKRNADIVSENLLKAKQAKKTK